METVYRVVLGFDEFGIHSCFQQLCFGSYEGVEIAKDLVEVLNGNCPGDYRIVHTDGFFTQIGPRSNCPGQPIFN